MENASKALIMAAGVLITILVASLWIFVFRQMASGVSNVNKIMETSEITEFNQQFLKYDGRGKKDASGNIVNPLNIHDVITIVNISRNNDKQETFPVHVEVLFVTHPIDSFVNSDLSKWSDAKLKNLMLNDIKHPETGDTEDYRKYYCEVKYSENDERFVNKILLTTYF